MIEIPKIVWVTGASSGIGRELCIQLIDAGWNVVGSSRSSNNLTDLKVSLGPKFHPMPLDINCERSVAETIENIEQNIGQISLAILNAGIYEPEEFGFDMSIARKTMHTNVLGTLNCLSEILKKFHNRQYGQIALMSSCAGYRGLPNAASYTASRATIINLAEALRFELEPKGIKIQVITPGFVATPLTEKNKHPMPGIVSAEIAAKRIIKGLKRSSFEITFPKRFIYIMKLLRLLPYCLYFPIIRRITKG